MSVQCQYCNKWFNYKSKFLDHVRQEHHVPNPEETYHESRLNPRSAIQRKAAVAETNRRAALPGWTNEEKVSRVDQLPDWTTANKPVQVSQIFTAQNQPSLSFEVAADYVVLKDQDGNVWIAEKLYDGTR
jgi:hypothetical protein